MQHKAILKRLRRSIDVPSTAETVRETSFLEIGKRLPYIVKTVEAKFVDGAFFASVDGIVCAIIDYQESKPIVFLSAECPSSTAILIFDAVYDICATRPLIAGTFYARPSEDQVFFNQDAHEFFILDQASQIVSADIKNSNIIDTNYLLALIEKTDTEILH